MKTNRPTGPGSEIKKIDTAKSKESKGMREHAGSASQHVPQDCSCSLSPLKTFSVKDNRIIY